MATIKDLKNGKYRIVYYYTINNEAHRPSETIEARSLAQATRIANAKEAELRSGKKPTDNKDIRFCTLVDKWKISEAEGYAHKTKEDWLCKLDNLILPTFGNKFVSTIKPHEIKTYLASLEKDGVRLDKKPGGYSGQTRLHHFTVINRMFNFGIENDYIAKNPCTKIKKQDLPIPEKKEAAFYDIGQMELLISKLEYEYEKGIDQWDWAPHHYNGKDWTERPNIIQIEAIKKLVYLMHKVYVRLAFSTTCRRSEMCGFEFGDIDYNKNQIILDRTSHYSKSKGVYTQWKLKNKAPNREIKMSPKYMEELKEYQQAMQEVRALMGDMWVDSDRLFIAVNGGKVSAAGGPINPTSITQWFGRFLKRHNLEHIPLHGLRHSGISLMINMGDTADIVAKRSGNSTKVIEKTYAHLFDDTKERSASYFDRF